MARCAPFRDEMCGWIASLLSHTSFWEAHIFTYLTARFGTPLLWEFQRFSWLGWGRGGMGNKDLGCSAPLLSWFASPLPWLMLQDSFGAVDAGFLSIHIRCRGRILWNHNCKKKTHSIIALPVFPPVLIRISIVTKHNDQKAIWEERVYWAYTSTL